VTIEEGQGGLDTAQVGPSGGPDNQGVGGLSAVAACAAEDETVPNSHARRSRGACGAPCCVSSRSGGTSTPASRSATTTSSRRSDASCRRRDLPTNRRSRSGVCTPPMEGESRSQPTNPAESRRRCSLSVRPPESSTWTTCARRCSLVAVHGWRSQEKPTLRLRLASDVKRDIRNGGHARALLSVALRPANGSGSATLMPFSP